MLTRKAGTPLAVSLHTSDFDVMAQGLPGWDARFSQMGHGSFDGQFDLVELPGFTFCRLKANREVLARGNHRPHTFGMGFPLVQQRTTSVSGQIVRTGQMICLGPGKQLDQITSSDYQSIFVEIDEDTFLNNVSILTKQDVIRHFGQVVLRPTAGAAQRMVASLDQIIAFAQKYPGSLANETLQRRMKQALMRRIVRLLEQSSEAATTSVTANHRRCLVQRTEEMMDAHLDGSLSMIDLCRELAVSERQLHYAFREVMAMTPMVLYRNKRLNAIRRYLKEIDPDETTIAEASLRFGFWHTGQFAADYARLFGELPSETFHRGRNEA